MQILLHLMVVLSAILAFLVGGCIGYGFGTFQLRALHRHEKLQMEGKLKHYSNVMPGSMTRVAMLFVVLVVVQLVCPIFFGDGMTQWWVSGGVMIGYGCLLFQRLQAKRKAGFIK